MGEAELFVGGRGNAGAGGREVPRLVRRYREAERRGIDDNEAVAAVGGVDAERPESLDLEARVEPVGKGGDVADFDRLRLAVIAVRPDADQSARCFQIELGDRFPHRQDAAVEQHGGDAHRIRAGHRRRVYGFHDDEAVVGLGMFRRQQQVDVLEHATAGFVEHEPAQPAILRDPFGLLPQAVAGRRRHAADDHVADLALGVAGNDVDDALTSHGRLKCR